MKCKILFPSLALLALTGCASYNATPLRSLASDSVISSSTTAKKDVVVVAKAFNKADCMRYLDRDVIAEGYQPVQLYIENNSNKDYVFSLSRINLSCARSEEVAEKVHTSTVGRAVGYGVGGLFLWPLFIPAVVDGIKSSEANLALDNDFSSKTANDQIISSHSYFNKVLFVPVNEFKPNFRIALTEKESKEIEEIEVFSS